MVKAKSRIAKRVAEAAPKPKQASAWPDQRVLAKFESLLANVWYPTTVANANDEISDWGMGWDVEHYGYDWMLGGAHAARDVGDDEFGLGSVAIVAMNGGYAAIINDEVPNRPKPVTAEKALADIARAIEEHGLKKNRP